jgi:hypothetical protein
MALCAQVSLLFFFAGIVTLHCLPAPMLFGATGKIVPYNPLLNFMSEFVRTQYGWLMTVNFCLLALVAALIALALGKAALSREAKLLWGASAFLVLLALFPSDLADLRTDAYTCGDPTRIEPCTLIGRIHNPLSTIVFGFVGGAMASFRLRRSPKLALIVRASVLCGVLAICLLIAAKLYLIFELGYTQRHWVGLMQRALTLPALVWLWVLAAVLRKQVI